MNKTGNAILQNGRCDLCCNMPFTNGLRSTRIRFGKRRKQFKKKQRHVKNKSVKRMRKQIGQKGGRAHAGSGSSIEQIKVKEKQMAAHQKTHGAFPSKRVAWKLFKVGGALWDRIVYTNSSSGSDSDR